MTATEPVQPQNVLADALRLAALGWRVLPIKPGEKRPPMASWQHAASSDERVIRNWFDGLYRGHGLGIATGRMGDEWVFVLDVDEKPGVSGSDTLADLERAHGALPATVEAHTGSGGRHIYLRAPVEIRNDAGRRLGLGLDIRGEGGQVLTAPTLHPNGRPYAWVIGQEPGEHDIAAAPAWLVDMLTIEPDVARPEHPATGGVVDDGPAARYNAATTWPELLERDGWTLHHVDRDGEQHWIRPGKDRREGTSATVGWQGNDMLRVFTSSVPWLPEGAYSRFGYHACRDHAGDRSAAARAIVEAERGPWRERLETLARNESVAGQPPDDAPPDDLLGLLLDWREFWNRDHKAEDWLLEPFIPAGRSVAIYAPGGTGKSLLSLYLAACAATGRPVLGHHVEPMTVLYLDYEMTAGDLYERLDAMGFGPDDELLERNLRYALLPAIDPLDTRSGARTVVELAALVDARIVMIDTFARAISGEENDADTIRDFYRHTGVALKAAGRACVRLDHSGKDRERGARGSSAKKDDVDVEWLLTAQEGGAYIMKATKRRVSWVPETVQLLLVDGDVLEFRLADSSTSVTMPAGTGEVADRLDRLGVPLNVSARKAGQMLAAEGLGARGVLVRAAVKFRNERARRSLETASQNPGRGPSDDTRDAVGTRFANPQVTGSGRGRDAADAVDQSKWDAVPPPRGDASQDPPSKPPLPTELEGYF